MLIDFEPVSHQTLLGVLQDLGLGTTFGGGDDADARVMVGIHEAQGTEAVEPSVGHPLDYGLLGGQIDLFLKLLERLFLLAKLAGINT